MRQASARGLGGLLLCAALALAACAGGAGGDAAGALSSSPSQSSSASSTPTALAQTQIAGTAPDPALIAADNGLGLRLLGALAAGGSSNIVISPISIALALDIVYNGAQGAAQTAMAQTLQLRSLTALDVNTTRLCRRLLDALNPDVTLTLANSLWTHSDEQPVLPAFVQINQTYYGATPGDLDGPAGTVDGDPNVWVSSAAQGLIPQLFPPGTDFSQDVALVINALYFKGAWSAPFNPDLTGPAPFTLTDGTQVTAQLILLPDPGVDLGSFLAGVTPAALDTWVAGMEVADLVIKLPRFSAGFKASLKPALTALGMGPAFGGSFAGIAPLATISDVVHGSVVDVYESGTTAAAARGRVGR